MSDEVNTTGEGQLNDGRDWLFLALKALSYQPIIMKSNDVEIWAVRFEVSFWLTAWF